MLSKISLVGVIFSLVIFSSCMKGNREAIRQADSLMTAIDSAEKKFLSVDTVLVQNILANTEHKVTLLKDFTPDSLDKQTTILLVDYIHLHRALEKFPDDRKNILSQISFSRKQLSDMKHDLDNNSMSGEEFAGNFQAEERAVAELTSYLNRHINKTGQHFLQYDFIKAKVDSFVTTLDTNREQEKKNPNLINESEEEE